MFVKLFKKNILYKLNIEDIDAIKEKQEVEIRFINDTLLFNNIKKILQNFNGLDELVSFCFQLTKNNLFESVKTTENKIHIILQMKKVLNFAMILKDALKGTKIPLLDHYYEVFLTPNLNLKFLLIIF